MLSIILPVYNEEGNIENAYRAIRDVLQPKGIAFELVYVNDGSKDKSFEVISELAETVQDAQILGISFSRNFGKEAAIFTGLSHAAGEVCAVMDCDLQHPPETLLEMYKLWEQGFEIIEGVKRSRGKENVVYKGFAKLFYKLISHSTGIEMYRSSDFKMLDRKVVNEYVKLPERNIFFRALSSWLGYKSAMVEFDVKEREVGKTKWSVNSLVKYAIGSICSFTTAPMQLITFSGMVFFFFAIFLGIQSLVKWATGRALEGFTTVILLLLIAGSLIMISLGIIGYYLARIYEEIKGRPRSIVDEVVKSAKGPDKDE
ncbi:MAG: glycosyltransferase family 2 protein [Bacteroidales bacterium]|nr:glycosyltransferase family 2 protein [Clostridium sp.]MCM1202987.1 glycosyltransferase family 2 protein [Bacteroidales bacterium]